MAALIFIHGLNTFGDDLLHVGPIKVAPMHSRLEKAFSADAGFRGHHFYSVPRLGTGSPEEQAQTVLEFLSEQKLLTESEPPMNLYFLGQSIGGIVARVVVNDRKVGARTRLVFTVGTPHHGTEAAQFACRFSRDAPNLNKIFRRFGYDTVQKMSIFAHYTPAAMTAFNLRYPLDKNSHCKFVALLCEVNRGDLALPLQLFYNQIHRARQASDGLISSQSQDWGSKTIGPYALDHFGELGFSFQLGEQSRAKSQAEFQRLVATIVEQINSAQKLESRLKNERF